MPETDWRDAQYDMLHLPVIETVRYHYEFNGNRAATILSDGEVQNYFYNLHDQLVKLEIFKKDGTKEASAYRYDALGRRISKARLKANANEVSDRHSADRTCLNTPNSNDILDSEIACIYTDADSYEPLAQIRNCTDTEDSNKQ